jgi:hypothetical protein
MGYRLLIDLEEILDGLPKPVRRRLIAQFYQIRNFPGNCSDYNEYDVVGRRVEISIHSGWAIHYWEDAATNT